jgi:predicted ABC-type ATPase
VADPVLCVIAGPNGAGKTTFFTEVLEPATHLEFVDADRIAASRWPGDELAHTYEASESAARERARRMAARLSFVTETVFSHPSKVDLMHSEVSDGYLVTLEVIAIPVELAVARVANRVAHGGHDVPESKVRTRYARLWTHIGDAITIAHEAHVYTNTSATDAFALVATYRDGTRVGEPDFPNWMPDEIRRA